MAASIWGYNVYRILGDSWTGWSSSNPSDVIELGPREKVLYRINTNIGSTTAITSLSIRTPCSADHYLTYFAALFDEDLSANRDASVIAHLSSSGSSPNKTFTFENLSLTGNQQLYVEIVNQSTAYTCIIQAEQVTLGITLPALTITGISPSTVIGMDSATVNFGGREGETLSLVLTADGTLFYSETDINSDSTTITPHRSWVDDYGSNNSLSVTATVSDANGRSASSNFTIRKATAITPSISAPKNGTYDASEAIAFSWTFGSGDGYAVASTLEYSTDNVNWQELARPGGGTSWTAPAATFPSGTVYWRIRTRNSYEVYSNWVSASFTAQYNEASATPIAPKNGTLDGGQAIDFSWSISKGSGTVTGVQMEISTNDGASWTKKVDSTSQITSFKAPAGSLTAGKIVWRVRAKDSLIGWSAWQQVNFTVQYTKPTVSLTAPTSGNRDGGTAIAFNWTIAAGSGNVTATQMQYSTDEGVSWNALVNDSKSVNNYTATAGKFPAGKVMWRVRAQDQYAGWSDWKSASFTVQYTVPTVTLTTPTSGTREGGETIEFAWSIVESSGSINGVQMQTSSDDGINWTTRLDVTTKRINFVVYPATLPPGVLKWRVRAKDSFAGWSEWKTASVTITYSATSYVVPLNSPTGGNVNAAEPITFAGTLLANGVPYQPFTMASATFYWRSRASDPYTEVSMTPGGANASVTIAGGTFPTGSVSWYISATDNAGTTTQTDVYTISTLASAIDAQPVAPVNTVEVSNDEITFTWKFASTSGEPQNGAELQYSLDGSTWEQLASVTGTATSYVSTADTFHAGTVYWRVRAFNSVGDAGEWSTVARFIAYGAPEAPSVMVDAVPFATIRWQGVGQVSYEVEVDGTVYGPFLGEEKAYELYDYLADGSHTARVRILGDADLWSLWGEVFFEITNVPESALTLTAETAIDTVLSWAGGNGDFFVYRDGLMIAHTNKHSFTDRVALGEHEYRVIERLVSGNYNASETLTQTPAVPYQHIAALAGGDWIAIPHTLKSQAEPSYQESQEVTFNYLSGNDYPTASIGSHKTDVGQYSAVFLYTEEAENLAFLTLRGKPVILKTADGEVMIGVLNAWERRPKSTREKKLYTAYTFSLQRIGWEDFIDDTL